jgi:hypothetical protein
VEIPDFKTSDGRLSEAALAALRDELARLAKFEVTPPLELEDITSGFLLSINQSPPLQYATVTTQAPAYNTSTKVYGKGVATLEVESYDASNVCTGALTSPAISVDFYNGGKDSIDVGHRVQLYEKIPGRMHAVTEFCV